ncbi:Lrp/AsnC family transcriptional regulator [Sphingomonas crocodyli]|uniref:Lrp/AsnC family transcriptional regulator n=1 Tax=Sphingomonas crocodyli TaxID=1979270 RepID=A0A437M7G8_9SPHN|nr:Lrp/AsnC family transcriptional regulator [Sphingomonas crocodyli]RVT93553.1 Lrp/AsnC family transcriptional regulator [Sphingomonas crocodyli]
MENNLFHAATLDPLDRRILRVLQRRGDISQADLALEVAASPASCWRRIKALEAADVLLEHVRLVDPYKVGRGLDVVCQVRLKSHEPEVRARFETFIQTQDQVLECLSMSGEWDYLLRVVAGDVREYETFLMRDLLGHPSVGTSASNFALARVKYSTSIPV